MSDRRRGFSTVQQLTVLGPLLVVWAVGVAGLGLAMLRAPDGRAELFLDPTASGGLPWYVGVYAELGAVGWTIACASAGFASFVSRRGGRLRAGRFLLGGAGVMAMYLADAVLQLHARVLPKTGVPKHAWIAVYGIVTLLWAFRHRDELRRTRWQILVAAGAALVVSGVVDVLLAPQGGVGVLAEDAAKFLGILAVAAYFVLTARDIMNSVLHQLEGATATETLGTTERGDGDGDDSGASVTSSTNDWSAADLATVVAAVELLGAEHDPGRPTDADRAA